METLTPLGDAAELPILLETSSGSSVRYYRRLGSGVGGHVEFARGGPDVWLMTRQPA
ncbi:MAG: hypothetical protein AAGF73_00825 [Actinomycetota bacterium]